MDVSSQQDSEVQQIVTFDDAAATQAQFLPLATDLSEAVLQPGREMKDHSIMDVLKRPVEIANITLPTGGDPDASVNILYQATFPDVLFNSEQNVADKATYFTQIRGTGVMRIILSSSPSSQGLLIASFIPDLSLEQVNLRTVNLAQLTQFSHIVIDTNSGIGGEVALPFLSTYDFKPLYKLKDGVEPPNNGTFIIAPLTPLSGITNIQLFTYYSDDLHLEHPTALPIDPDLSPTARLTSWIRQNFGRLMRSNPEMLKTYPGKIGYTAQMSEAARQQKSGILSGVLDTAASLTTVASGLPVVGNVAKAATPLLGIGSTIAKMFGFSKPLNQQPTNPLIQNPFSEHLTAEGQDVANTFNYHVNNTVKSHPGEFGTEVDEMSIDYICGHEQIIPMMTSSGNLDTGKYVRKVTSSNVAGDIIAVIPIAPAFWLKPTTSDSKFFVTAFLSHFAWVFSFFQFWSATIKLRFKFAMTGFHKVQLRFSFVPGAVPSTTFTTLNYNNANSTVKALSAAENEHNMTIPALRPVSALRVGGLLDGNCNATNCAGYIVISVATPLSYTDAVSPEISFVCFATLEDTKLSVPATRGLVFPVKYTPPPPSPYASSGKDETDRTIQMEVSKVNVTPQSAGELNIRVPQTTLTQADRSEKDPTLATTSTASATSLEPFAGSVGEITNSLLQLCKTYTQTSTYAFVGPPDGDEDYPEETILYTPSIYTEAAIENLSTNKIDLMDSIGAGFAFQKGGYFVRVVPTGSYQEYGDYVVKSQWRTNNLTSNKTWFPYVVDMARAQDPQFIKNKFFNIVRGYKLNNVTSRYLPCKPDLQGGFTVQMPYNQPTGRILNAPPENSDFKTPIRYSLAINKNEVVGFSNTQRSADLTLEQWSGETLHFFRRGADDFRYGTLIALPEMAYLKTTIAPPEPEA